VPIASVKSLEKAIDLIRLFSKRQPTLALPEIATALNIPESTVYRLLRTLQKKQVIVRDSATRKYTLDASLLRIEAVIRSRLSINRAALPHLQKLATQSAETAHFHLLQGHQITLVEAVSSPNIMRFALDIGTIQPLYAGAGGRAILAFLSDSLFDECVRLHGFQKFTPYTVTDPQKIRQLLLEVRSRGFAITSQQTVVGAMAVAAPVFNHQQEAFASIAVVGPMSRFTKSDALALGPHVRKHADELSATFGASDTS
jgi:DNA-binding IclR family transcriptional regulator